MIDKKQLSELGWSDELIDEVTRIAGGIVGPDEPNISDIDEWNERVLVGASVFDNSVPQACGRFILEGDCR